MGLLNENKNASTSLPNRVLTDSRLFPVFFQNDNFFQTQGCQVGDQQTSQKHNSKAFFMLYFKHMGKFE